MAFAEALAYAHSLNLTSQNEWHAWCQKGARPANMPPHPEQAYSGDGWQGWDHWLNAGDTSDASDETREAHAGATDPAAGELEPPPHKKARVWGLADKGPQAGCQGVSPPAADDSPLLAATVGGSFLSTVSSMLQTINPFASSVHGTTAADPQAQASAPDTGTHAARAPPLDDSVHGDANEYLPFERALGVAHRLRLNNRTEWATWCQGGTRPANVPAEPQTTYKDSGWQGWAHWLTGRTPAAGSPMRKEYRSASVPMRKEYLPFDEAVAYARGLQLDDVTAWKAWCKSGAHPPNIPLQPHNVYKDDGWQSWAHWLNRHPEKRHRPFDEALAVARSLELNSPREWEAWCRTDARPADIPFLPFRVYKDSGWQDWGHWLSCTAEEGATDGEALATAKRRRAAVNYQDVATDDSDDAEDQDEAGDDDSDDAAASTEDSDVEEYTGPVVWAPWGKTSTKKRASSLAGRYGLPRARAK